MKPEISIIIEWENCILADTGRSIQMLEQLRKQIHTLHRAVEVIVLFDPEQIEGSLLENELVNILKSSEQKASCSLRVEEASGKHYYELKNEGAKLAKGGILVFLDSDVIPEDGWLPGMVEPFYDNPNLKVLAGSSYIDPKDLYSKAFALGWFFPLRSNKASLHDRSNNFWGNNIAFRRETFMQFPFPQMPQGSARGSGITLAKQLRNEGITIWTNTGAHVSHPAPNGFSHFYKRAMSQGRDHWLRNYNTVNSSFGVFLIKFYFKRTGNAVKRIVLHHRAVDLPVWQTQFAILIMASYYTLALIGGFITLSMPGYAKSSWRI